MEIIILSGKDNCGKTTTLNLIYDSINPPPADIIEEKKSINDPKNKDFECIIRYNGKTVAFYTNGDYKKCLIMAIKEYAKKPCDVLVCASRDNKIPRQLIKNYPHTIINKTMSLYDALNEIDKNKIMQLL